VRDDAAIRQAVDRAMQEFGRIDILFNNAGICAYAEVDTITDDEWNAMIDINLKGPMNVTRRVVPHMKQAKRGVIINNSSVMGLRGGRRLSHYVASKWGLTGLTKAWALELAPFNIRVVSIHPTGVNTPMNDGIAALEGATPEEIAERSAGNLIPVPWIEPEDVVPLVLYLASDDAKYATGGQYLLDAGLLSM
jgi:NAD(P)-dependent dehydrogenase (short-subunit alcohol dehydrogenase family)